MLRPNPEGSSVN